MQILNVKREIRALVIGAAVVALPDRSSLQRAIEHHRNRIAALNEQADRSSVRRDPRRHCEVVLAREHHEEQLAMLQNNLRSMSRPTPPQSPDARRRAREDRAMSADWVNQLEAARSALVA